MIVFPRQMPVGGVVGQGFEIQRVDFSTSVTGGRLNSVTAGSPLWVMSMTLNDGDEDEVAEWRAFLSSLRGSQKPFLAGDLTRPFPKAYRDGFTGVTRASGGAFDGTAASWSVNPDRDVMSFTGLPAGMALSITDYVMLRWSGINRRSLHRLIEPATASGAGAVSVSVEPPVPNHVPGTAVADFAKPQCVMKMITDKSQIGELDALHSASGSLYAMQDLRA